MTEQLNTEDFGHGDQDQLDGAQVKAWNRGYARASMDLTNWVMEEVLEAEPSLGRLRDKLTDLDNANQRASCIGLNCGEQGPERDEQLAYLADVSLGEPTYISEGSISSPVTRDYYYEAGGMVPVPAPAPTTSISPGETEIRLNVQVVYSIK